MTPHCGRREQRGAVFVAGLRLCSDAIRGKTRCKNTKFRDLSDTTVSPFPGVSGCCGQAPRGQLNGTPNGVCVRHRSCATGSASGTQRPWASHTPASTSIRHKKALPTRDQTAPQRTRGAVALHARHKPRSCGASGAHEVVTQARGHGYEHENSSALTSADTRAPRPLLR